MNGSRHGALVQPDRHNVDLVQRHLPRAIQRIADFRLEATLFAHRLPGETRHEEIRAINRRLDRPRPVLPGQQLSYIHPGIEPRTIQIFVEPHSEVLIFASVGDKDLWQRSRLEAEAAPRIRVKDAQPVDLYRLPFSHAAQHNACHLTAGIAAFSQGASSPPARKSAGRPLRSESFPSLGAASVCPGEVRPECPALPGPNGPPPRPASRPIGEPSFLQFQASSSD